MVFVVKKGETRTRRTLRRSVYMLRRGLGLVKKSVQRVKLAELEVTPLPKARFKIQTNEEYHVQHCDLTTVYDLTGNRPVNFCPFCSLNLRQIRQQRSLAGLSALYGSPIPS